MVLFFFNQRILATVCKESLHTEFSHEECTLFSEIRFLFCFFAPNGNQSIFPEFQWAILGDLGIELEALLS